MTSFLSIPRSGKLVLEMIDFQVNDPFGRDLELHITEIIAAVKEGTTGPMIQRLEEVKRLETTIFKRLGMRVSFQCNSILAAILPLYSNQHHILLDKQWHGNVDIDEQIKFMKSASGKTGVVDTKNAKLGGFFSEYVHTVYMNFNELVNTFKLSAASIVAILLHELGHGFYACEYSDRYSSTNQVLANVAREMAKEKSKRNPNYIYKELTKINPETKKEMIDDIVMGERVIPDVEMFKYIIDTTTRQLDNAKYDDTSFENLADNFATRFGYGAALTEGLVRINEVYPENEIRKAMFTSAVLGMLFMLTVGLLLFFTGGVGLGIFYTVIGFMMGMLMVSISGEQGRDYTYDDIKFRYKRIRDQLVQQIKLKAFTVKDAHQLVQQIEFMDDLVKKTGQYRSTLDLVMNYIRPANFRAKKSIERQQLLEDLSSNGLFVQSLKLQLLANK